MAVSKWRLMDTGSRCASLDSISPNTNFNLYNCGILFLGESKAFLRRPILAYDMAATPHEGNNINYPEDVIVTAHLEGECLSVGGLVSQPATCHRITRDDWVRNQATWNVYKTASNWTTGGGDIGTPPAALAFTTPAGVGAYEIQGLKEWVEDAFANRSSRLHMRHKLDDETQNGIDRHYALAIGNVANTLTLVVEYVPASERLSQFTGAGRDRITVYDHVLTADRQGRMVREIERMGRSYEDAGRASAGRASAGRAVLA